MAYTASANVGGTSTVFGNQRVWQGTVSADAASGTVTPGNFGQIYQVDWAPMSMTSTGIRVRANALASGTAAAGTLGFSGCASGDDIYVTVYGR